MQQARATGPNAPALKYDILTALMVLGAQDDGVDGRLARRLALLITARFSWRTESFAVGTREIARLWGVTERTAKRELSQMRARSWISIRRAPARGRVTEHAIHLQTVLDATRAHWAAVGPDFVARMGRGAEEEQAPTNVVPFRGGAGQGGPVHDGTVWQAASHQLWSEDAALHTAWFAGLAELDRVGPRLELAAPSRFIATYVETHFAGRLLAAVSSCDPTITEVSVRG